MSYDVCHCLEGPLVLVARSNGLAALAGPCALRHQHRNLGTELGELERAGKKGDDGAGCGTSSAKATDRVEVGIGAGLADVSQNVEIEILLDPASIHMLGSLIK